MSSQAPYPRTKLCYDGASVRSLVRSNKSSRHTAAGCILLGLGSVRKYTGYLGTGAVLLLSNCPHNANVHMRAHQCPGHGRVHEDADDDDGVDDEPGGRGELHQPRPVPRAGHQLRPLPAQPRQQQRHHQHRLPASGVDETSYDSHCYLLPALSAWTGRGWRRGLCSPAGPWWCRGRAPASTVRGWRWWLLLACVDTRYTGYW